MEKRTVGILFGGANSEHEVSLMSSTSVLNNIDRDRYDVVMVGITRDGRWLRYTGPVDSIIDSSWEQHPENCPAFLSPDRSVHGLVTLRGDRAEITPLDAVFPVMHGRFAEDGSMQGLLDLAGIPCVGPGVCASAICMDKEYTHIVLDAAGVKTSDWFCVRKNSVPSLVELEVKIAVKLGGFPVFVKPCNAGSSVGVSKVKNSDQLEEAMELAFRHDSKLLIEKAMVGKEVEVAVMGNDDPVASDHLGEIVPKLDFYDYNSKYYDDTADLYIPARITDEETQLIRETAVKAFRALGCRGLARVDFFLLPDGSCVLNEPNTLPGFTHISMYPKLFIDSGMTYPEIIDRLITLAIEA
ncbi:MAG: D-alanine--D-alanine ligase [Clostridiales bacterium]|nr:D-alanine--D-alanine ligase [Clostridiales bacterium]